MTQSTPNTTQQDAFTFDCGFVSIDSEFMLAAEQYKPKEDEIKEFIKSVSKKQTLIKLSDIKISNQNAEYTISIQKNEFTLNFDFNAINKDVKRWPALQSYVKQFLHNKVLELAYSYLRTKYKALTEVPKGITKKPRRMLEGERLTAYDYETKDALFEYIKGEGQFNEVKELLDTKRLLHLKNNYQYVYDALLYYVHLYRYALQYKEHEKKNKRNGKAIVAMTSQKDDNSDATYGKKLIIQDDWFTFCKRAGINNAEDRHKLAKDLKKGGSIPAISLAKTNGENELRSITSFIVFEFSDKPAKNSNLANAKSYTDEIIMYVDPRFLSSILDVSGKGSGGWVHFPQPLQKILERVFEDEDRHIKLKGFCARNGFKRITGERFSPGYRKVYEEIHADIYRRAEPNFTYKGKPCHLIVLNEDGIKDYAKRCYPRAIKKSGRFSRKEAIEFLMTGMEVIRLATGDKDKDYISILGFDYMAPAIHIYVDRMTTEKSLELEKLLLKH